MPCIVCRKERMAFMRIPLEVLSQRRENYLRENYFTNFEYDHICRICSLKDQTQRFFVGAWGFVFDFVLKAGMIALAVLTGYAFCIKWGLPRPALLGGPVLFGLAFGGVLGVRFVRLLAMAGSGIGLIVGLLFLFSHSDYLSILPDIT